MSMFGKKQRVVLKDLLIGPKTGLYKKKYFFWILRQEINRIERTNQPLSMLIIKISFIKDMIQSSLFDISFNKIIEAFIPVFEDNFRKTDIKGWYDNDKLAILMPNTPGSGASVVWSKLREALTRSLEQIGFKSNINFNKAYSIHTYPDSLLLKVKNPLEKNSELEKPLQCYNIFYENISEHQNKMKFQRFMKRCIDLAGSITGLLFLFPLMLIIGIIIKLTSPGPIFFRQIRLGYLGIPFIFYKFRSMYYGADDKCHREYVNKLIQGNYEKINLGSGQEPVLKMNNDPRITPFGSFLRKSSLDELPQLFNVIKGEMSLVGPRPPIPYEIEKYQIWHLKRILEVKQGITGLWQVYGRSRTTFDNMVRMDLKYAENWSIVMDIKILFKTIKTVLFAKGAY